MSWTCHHCGVTSSFAQADAPTRPEGWVEQEAGWICLGCRRSEVVESSREGDSAGRTGRRRRALAEFELRRDPGAPNHVIAKRVNCPTHFIAPIRSDLATAGEIAATAGEIAAP